jgi:hypothetical protein
MYDMNVFDDSEQVDLDELFEKKQTRDRLKLDTLNKLLSRVHKQIKMSSRLSPEEPHCWFNIPDDMVGSMQYDPVHAADYIMDKLITNNFQVKKYNPNVLLISWSHWVPTYVRKEILKKTGMNLDCNGELIEPITVNTDIPKKPNTTTRSTHKYKSIDDYHPTGDTLYNKEMFSSIESKIKNVKI